MKTGSRQGSRRWSPLSLLSAQHSLNTKKSHLRKHWLPTELLETTSRVKSTRKCANDYWLDLCRSIQVASGCGNIRAMYERMKKAFGPSAIKIAPLKSTTGEIITDCSKQMERWAEHYQELYSRETTVTNTAIESTTLPTMEELDTPPTVDELTKAIKSLASGKAPGSDGLPPEIVKLASESSLLSHLHDLLLQCWEEGTIPQDMRDAKIVTLYKNKGERSDCNNYRGISSSAS